MKGRLGLVLAAAAGFGMALSGEGAYHSRGVAYRTGQGFGTKRGLSGAKMARKAFERKIGLRG